MTDVEDIISFSEAAEEKGCGRNTLYRAANDGRLNETKVGGRRMLIRDEAYESFAPKETGARVHGNKHTDASDSDTDA